MPRSLTVADLSLIEEWKFVEISFSAPYGNLYLTNRPGGYTGDVGTGAKTYTEVILDCGPFSLSSQDVLVVNWIKFADLTDNYWSDLGKTITVRGVPITVITGIFDSNSEFDQSYIEYKGTIDEAEFREEATFSLIPHISPWANNILFNKIGGKCINDFMNPEDCQHPFTAGLTCAKTRAACRDYANEHHINIYDDVPKPNDLLIYTSGT